jgi:hypothetical protein
VLFRSRDDLSEIYLRRALTLNYHELAVFQFQDVLVTLGQLAFRRRDYAAALQAASACLELMEKGNRALSALSLAADVCLRMGTEDLLVQPDPRWIIARPVVAVPDHGGAVAPRAYFEQAQSYLHRLLECPELSAEGIWQAKARLAQCAAALDVLPAALDEASPAAAATLQVLLAADDLPGTLQAHADQLDAGLLALVRRQVEVARGDGDPDLADGLENLAAYVAAQLEARLAAAGRT